MSLQLKHENGFCGLSNLGNTCFINACLQCLNHTYELQQLFAHPKIMSMIKPNRDDGILTQEWIDLSKMMWNKNGVLSPNRFLYAVQTVAKNKNRNIFTGYAQNDVCEFLLFLMDSMHESICRKVEVKITGKADNIVDKMAVQCYELLQTIYSKEYSEIMELFYGMYITLILDDQQKETLSMHPEQFFVLDLQLFHGNKIYTSIYDCFDAFIRPEHLYGDNAWMNDSRGKKENVYKITTFWSLPDILVLCLKRFSYDGTRKLQHLVDFPLQSLDLGKYVKGYNSKKYVYDLYGICNHSGGVQGGHYTAYIKHMNGKWYHFNDNVCTFVENTVQMISPSAYCLFYRIRK